MPSFPVSSTLALIGVPTDAGASMRGACLGPGALRVAGLAEALLRRGLAVIDRGDLAGPPYPGPASHHDGYRHLDEVTQWNTLVHRAVSDELRAGHLPVLLGGDHSVAIGSISAAAQHCRRTERELRVLWLDAHADFNTRELTPSGNLHGMPVACLCGDGPPALVSLGGPAPALQAQQIRQIGVRSVDDGERSALYHAGIAVYDMRAIDELGMRSIMANALKGLTGNTHLHVSFDVDFHKQAQTCFTDHSNGCRLGSGLPCSLIVKHFHFAQFGQRIEATSELESTHALEVFTFDKDLRLHALVQKT